MRAAAITTARYQVKPGATLPHGGEVLQAGAFVELPLHVGAELAHLVVEVDATGQPVAPPSTLDRDLARAQPHERISLLEQELVVVTERRDLLLKAIAAEKGSAKPAVSAPKPPKTEKAPTE